MDFESETYGTLEFMAPEVLASQIYGEEGDIWAIGVVAYTLLSGMLPFFADDRIELWDKIVECKLKYN